MKNLYLQAYMLDTLNVDTYWLCYKRPLFAVSCKLYMKMIVKKVYVLSFISMLLEHRIVCYITQIAEGHDLKVSNGMRVSVRSNTFLLM